MPSPFSERINPDDDLLTFRMEIRCTLRPLSSGWPVEVAPGWPVEVAPGCQVVSQWLVILLLTIRCNPVHMRSKGLCDPSWCLLYIYLDFFFGTNLLSPKILTLRGLF